MPKDKSPRQEFEERLAGLAEKFERRHADYLHADYSEAQARLDFINPLFEALGWDIRNETGLGPKEREVVVEQGETSGRPDYNFRLNGRTIFYAEAKAPHVSLERTDVVMQAKLYAWNSQEVFISAVTDFEGFRLYDTTVKPDRKHPDVGLIFAYRYSDYLKSQVLDDLWMLSKESVAGGSIDRLLKMSSVKAHQRIPVDQAFLDDLTSWREKLAKAVYKVRPDWDVADLNSAVQVFLDRLIFIRIAEDRGILPPRELEDIAGAWKLSGKRRSIINDLNALFHEVNGLLNGEIFKPHLCEKVDWDQNADLVVDIINKLYPPESLYRFDVIGVELLGSIYERYLGKTIRVTATRAVVEDKPQVRKAGGVYYTPKYIVDYIIDQTVGKLIEGRTPAQIAKLKILDPACGSGSFLLGAYQKLLDYHTRYYAERAYRRDAQRAAPQARLMRDGEGGEFKLTLLQKAEILRNNIYGVDIDLQAVEITMMSLYIKLLEGERGLMINHAALPPLRDNIKCGNSLIGHDIVHQPDLFSELSPKDRQRINPFDWESESEGFCEIMQAGGFDAVIGNPPYGAYLYEADKTYLRSKFKHQSYQLDSYLLFLERILGGLLRRNGFYGMIIPNPWLTNLLQQSIRRFVAENTRIVEIVHFLFPVFPQVTVDTEIVVLQKANPKAWQTLVTVVESLDAFQKTPLGDGIKRIRHTQDKWRALDGEVINIFTSPAEESLARKCSRAGAPLGSLCAIHVGIKPYQVGKGTPPQTRETVEKRIYDSSRRLSATWRLYLRGSDIGRYKTAPLEPRYLKYGPWLAEPRPAANFDAPVKIVMRQTGDSIVATIDTDCYLCLNNMHVLVPIRPDPSPYYVLGVLNSRLLNWFYHTLNPEVGEALAEVKKTNAAKLPVRLIDLSNLADKTCHDKMVSLVKRMLITHQELQTATSEATRARIEREIHVTDEQIDALAYELYRLTDEEIRVVEGAV